jgi:uncharacterized protein YccT (UPF0319 family)
MKIAGLFLTLAVVSPFTFAGEIVTPIDVELLAVNGEKVKSPFIGQKTFEVADGKQQVVVRYSRTFNGERLTESRPYIMVVDVAGKTEISTDKLTSYSQAVQKVRSKLDWYVKNEKTEYTVKAAEELKGDGLIPYSNIEGVVAEYNDDNNLQVTPTSVSKVTTNNLIEQYKAASVEQKKQFKMWLINSETK